MINHVPKQSLEHHNPHYFCNEGNALIMDLDDALADVSASTSEEGKNTLEVELKQISQMWTKHLKQIQDLKGSMGHSAGAVSVGYI